MATVMSAPVEPQGGPATPPSSWPPTATTWVSVTGTSWHLFLVPRGDSRMLAQSVGLGVENHRLLPLRHGETEWSKSGQHTGRTELELTDTGREKAEAAGGALRELKLENLMVIRSPRRRTLATAEFASLSVDEVSPLIAEWDYGCYEGLTTAQTRE